MKKCGVAGLLVGLAVFMTACGSTPTASGGAENAQETEAQKDTADDSKSGSASDNKKNEKTKAEPQLSDEEQAEKLMKQAKKALREGNREEAIEKYKEATKYPSVEGHAFYKLGEVYEEDSRYKDALAAYGQAYWVDRRGAKKKMLDMIEIIGIDNLSYAELIKYNTEKPFVKAQDDTKTNHIRLQDGTIVEAGNAVPLEKLEGAVFVMNDESLKEGDYNFTCFSSEGQYAIKDDPDLTWSYQTIMMPGKERSLEEDIQVLSEGKYDNLYFNFIQLDDYNQFLKDRENGTAGEYPDIELNFHVTR